MAGTKKNKPRNRQNATDNGKKTNIWEEAQEAIPGMKPRDDTMFASMIDGDPTFARNLLATMLRRNKKSVIIRDIQIERVIKLWGLGRGVRIDALLNEKAAVIYAIEVENKRKRASPERMRYIGSALDVFRLDPSDDFGKLPARYVIMLAPFSIKGEEQAPPIDEFVMMSPETGAYLNDGVHVVTVDLNASGTGEVADMIHDFSTANPAEMRCGWMAARAHELKNTKEGRKHMSAVMEKLIAQATEELRKESRKREQELRKESRKREQELRKEAREANRKRVINLLETTNLSKAKIAETFDMPLKEVKELARKHRRN